MDSFNKVPEYQKAELIQFIEEQQIRDSMKLYNSLVESCFNKCVNVGWLGSLKSKTLSEDESKCITSCAEKYLKLQQRVGYRFAENQAVALQTGLSDTK